MTNEIKGGGADNELSTDINVITAEINAYQRVAGEAIFEIGRRLKYVKENDLAHGEFGKWCEESIGIDKRRASEFITVFEQLNGEKFHTYGKLGMNALYQIATLPPEQREQTHVTDKGEEKKPEDMTVKELRELKKALRQAEEECERLEIENEELAERESEIVEKEVVKTEYIEVDNTPSDYDDVKLRLEEYRKKFGDIENYDEHITATHRQDMIVAVMSFSQGVREFIKRYEYMTRYKTVIDNLDGSHKEQYDEAVNALKGMAQGFEFTEQGGEIIDIVYDEVK